MRAGSGRDEPTSGEEDTYVLHRWRALTVCLIAAFMMLLDVSIVNVALPSIREGLHASESGLQWIISGYALTFGLVLVPAGRLGDARGRRAVFMIGLAAFTVASIAAGAARNITWLVVARLAQGAAGGMTTPQITGFIQLLFRGAERGRAFGRLGAVIGIATAAGPIIGGALISLAGATEGWRWVFYVNVPVGVIALPVAWRLLPPGARKKECESLDPVGVALLAGTLAALLLPLVQAQQWHGGTKWLLLVVAAVLMVVFLFWERRHGRRREPVIDLTLFRETSYARGSALALLYFAGFTAVFFIFTLYLQNGLGYSALQAGAAMTPFAAGSGVTAAAGGRFVTRLGRPLVAAGLGVVAVGFGFTLLAVHLVPGPHAGLATALPLLVAGAGSGMVISPNQTLTLTRVPVRQGGAAGGVLQTAQRIGTAIGIAVVGSVYFSTLTGTRGDWAMAFQWGLIVIIAFVVASGCVALLDVLADRRGRRREPARR